MDTTLARDDRRLRALQRGLPLWLALGAAVALGVTVAADFGAVTGVLGRFRIDLLVPILALTIVNYGLRFGKWTYYLHLIGAPPIGRRENATIFFAGLSMTMTPGKVGEWLKSYLLQIRHGVPFATSAPIIVAERLTDGLAMMLLAMAGLLGNGLGWEILLAVAALGAAIVALSQARTFVTAVLARVSDWPLVGPRTHHLLAFYESSRRLLAPRPLAAAIVVGVVSWGAECFAFYLVLIGLGVSSSIGLVAQSAFVLAVASLAGSLSMLPGGLGVAEGSIAGLLLFLGVTDQVPVAAAATLVIRFATLWFGVAIGTIALATIARRA